VIAGVLIGMLLVVVIHVLSQSFSAEFGIFITFVQLAVLFTQPAKLKVYIELNIFSLTFMDTGSSCIAPLSPRDKLLLRKLYVMWSDVE
jgi:hypothetical protein